MHEVTHVSIGLEDIHPPEFYRQMNENWKIYRSLKSKIVSTAGGVGVDAEILDGEVLQGMDDGAIGSDFQCGARKRWTGRWRRRSGGAGTKRAGGGRARGVNTGEKRRPLLKGKRMRDGRTAKAKKAKVDMKNLTPRELALRAAEARAGVTLFTKSRQTEKKGDHAEAPGASEVIDLCSSSSDDENDNGDDDDDDDFGDDYLDNDYDDDDDKELDRALSQHLESCGCRVCVWEKALVPDCPIISSSEKS